MCFKTKACLIVKVKEMLVYIKSEGCVNATVRCSKNMLVCIKSQDYGITTVSCV